MLRAASFDVDDDSSSKSLTLATQPNLEFKCAIVVLRGHDEEIGRTDRIGHGLVKRGIYKGMSHYIRVFYEPLAYDYVDADVMEILISSLFIVWLLVNTPG